MVRCYFFSGGLCRVCKNVPGAHLSRIRSKPLDENNCSVFIPAEKLGKIFVGMTEFQRTWEGIFIVALARLCVSYSLFFSEAGDGQLTLKQIEGKQRK